jgi:hypothetical protein
MTRRSLRPIFACFVVAAMCLAGAREGAAQRVPPIEKFDGMAVDASGPKIQNVGRIEIAIERWSKDGDGEKLGAAAADGAKLLDTLKNLGSPIGVIISPGIQGVGARARERRSQSLLYARDIKTPKGRQVVFATDEHLGFTEPGRERVRSEKNEFTIIDIRFGADGKGTGKMALADHVTYNKQTKSIELAGYDKLPVAFVDLTATKRAR